MKRFVGERSSRAFNLTVYLESNFILELALDQEQAAAASAILARAESGEVELAFPAFSLSEPFATVIQRARRRDRFVSTVNEQLRELRRSPYHEDEIEPLTRIPAAIELINAREIERLVEIVERTLAIATLIPTDLPVFRQAMTLRREHDLSVPDSIIYVAVITHLSKNRTSGPHSFINKNSKDFQDPAIIDTLSNLSCTFLPSFSAGASLFDKNLG